LDIIRKAFWPAAVAIGFLVFLAAFVPGGSVQKAQAFPGDICAIEGPRVIGVGQTVLYRVRVEDPDELNLVVVDIDDLTGDSDITSVASFDDEYEIINPTNTIGNLDVVEPSFWDQDFLDSLEAMFGNFTIAGNVCGVGAGGGIAAEIRRIVDDAILAGEVCAAPGTAAPSECATDNNVPGLPDIDCPSQSTCTIANATVTAIVNALVAGMAAGLDCDELALEAQKAAIDSGAHVTVGNQVFDWVIDVCVDGMIFGDEFREDGIGFFDVTCNTAGTFEISVFDSLEQDNALSITVTCLGPGALTITPASIEIVPAAGNISSALIRVAAPPGAEVQFTTDRCAIETAAVATAANLATIQALYTAFAAGNLSVTAPAIQASTAVTGAVDSTPLVDIAVAFDTSSATTASSQAAAILMCSGNFSPGVANITAIIAQTGVDTIVTGTVTVVGPPVAPVVVTPALSNVICGESVPVTVTVKDAAGQPVSDHTRVEVVTNFGGVLGGTGAVAGQAGLVSPLSSTVAETFNGVATLSLVTSQTQTGTYTLVVATGGGGSVAGLSLGGVFSTPTVTGTATVSCSAAAAAGPAATVTAPRTGTGITPPNTGDAGLANASGAGLSLFVIAGLAALALTGFAGLKLVRR